TWINKSHKRYSVRVEERTGKFGINLNLLDTKTICTGVSRMQKGPWMNELSETDIWISDVGPDQPDIEMLIGNDVFGRLLTGRVEQLRNGLTATETKLGWTLSGELIKIPKRFQD